MFLKLTNRLRKRSMLKLFTCFQSNPLTHNEFEYDYDNDNVYEESRINTNLFHIHQGI